MCKGNGNLTGKHSGKLTGERIGKLIVVTGPFGAPIKETARELAASRGLPLVDLDEEIERRDGRSIKRLVMMNGEHGYRNKEYEVLQELAASLSGPAAPASDGAVVACGDGVLYDDDSRGVILAGELVVAGEDMTADELWERAKTTTDSYHAFMSFGTEEEKRAAFDDLIERQRTLMADAKTAAGNR